MRKLVSVVVICLSHLGNEDIFPSLLPTPVYRAHRLRLFLLHHLFLLLFLLLSIIKFKLSSSSARSSVSLYLAIFNELQLATADTTVPYGQASCWLPWKPQLDTQMSSDTRTGQRVFDQSSNCHCTSGK